MKEKIEEEKGFELVQVPATFSTAIQNPEGDVLTIEQALVYILNLLRNLDQRI